MDKVDGRFTLERLVGRGAFGEAHAARDQDGQLVVLKLLHAEHATNEALRERFRREVVALERLHHPNVVRLVAHGVCPLRGQPYYAMEFSRGESLEKVLAREKKLPLARTLGLMEQLLSALEAAHALGIVHRDLKPENLLVESAPCGERLQVIDFGLAKHRRGGSHTVADLTGHCPLGSPAYMAPEQCRGVSATEKADIYAAGCIAMHLLTGEIVFPSSRIMELLRHHAETRAPRLDQRLPGAPPLLVELIAVALEKRPEDRPDAATLRAGFARVARELGPLPDAASRSLAGAELAGTLVPPAARWIPASTAPAEPPPPPPPPPGEVAVALLPLARPRTARLGRSAEPLPDTGDALRGLLEVEAAGSRRTLVLLFAGTRVRFGRNANRGAVENDLVLRAFPRPGEAPERVRERTRDVSGHHGTFVVTRDGLAVRDDGSKLGTELDGAPLAKHALVPVAEQFLLEVASVVGLRGRVILSRGDGARGDGARGPLDANGRGDGPGAERERLPGVPASHPVAALRLERTRDGEHVSYVLVLGETLVGSGTTDAVHLPHAEVMPGHARLAVRRGRFAIGPARAGASVSVGGRTLAAGELAELAPGAEIALGAARLRFAPARDDDMKP